MSLVYELMTGGAVVFAFYSIIESSRVELELGKQEIKPREYESNLKQILNADYSILRMLNHYLGMPARELAYLSHRLNESE
tara:strand:+ start:948 stop:1190 length:243 start_codon:yes stop_codon:yes gene_type:complete